ncbi:Transcriptional regulator CRZ1, partial [Spathaspora sp. JA1]
MSSHAYSDRVEDQQLYDILNLSPPTIVVKPSGTSDSLTNALLNDGAFMDYSQSPQQYDTNPIQKQPLGRHIIQRFVSDQQKMHTEESIEQHNLDSFEPPSAPIEDIQQDPLPEFNYVPETKMYDEASDISLHNINPGGSGQFNSNSTSNEYLSPISQFANQFSNMQQSDSIQQQQQQQQRDYLQVKDDDLLHPNSPMHSTTHSIYSDTSSHPASPYISPMSQFSSSHNLAIPPQPNLDAFSDVGSHNGNNIPQGGAAGGDFIVSSDQYLDSAAAMVVPTNFEIGFGESISSTNLTNLDSIDNTNGKWQPSIQQQEIQQEFQQLSMRVHQFQQQQQQQRNQTLEQQQENTFDYNSTQNLDFDILVTPPLHSKSIQPFDTISTAATNNSNYQSNPLTELNLHQLRDDDEEAEIGDSSGIMISINQAPQAPHAIVAARTPSLFSNSSANSSIRNSPSIPTNNNKSSNLVPNSELMSPIGSSGNSDTNNLLDPDYQNIKRGRRKSHSMKSTNGSTSPRPSRSPSTKK